MPSYDYICATCGPFEAQQRITEPKLPQCPACRAPDPKRLISGAPSFSLVAGDSGGWSSTGYAKPENFRKAEKRLGHKVRRQL